MGPNYKASEADDTRGRLEWSGVERRKNPDRIPSASFGHPPNAAAAERIQSVAVDDRVLFGQRIILFPPSFDDLLPLLQVDVFPES